jgi:hypothetical protein
MGCTARPPQHLLPQPAVATHLSHTFSLQMSRKSVGALSEHSAPGQLLLSVFPIGEGDRLNDCGVSGGPKVAMFPGPPAAWHLTIDIKVGGAGRLLCVNPIPAHISFMRWRGRGRRVT